MEGSCSVPPKLLSKVTPHFEMSTLQVFACTSKGVDGLLFWGFWG